VEALSWCQDIRKINKELDISHSLDIYTTQSRRGIRSGTVSQSFKALIIT